jgi:hypothetical protein
LQTVAARSSLAVARVTRWQDMYIVTVLSHVAPLTHCCKRNVIAFAVAHACSEHYVITRQASSSNEGFCVQPDNVLYLTTSTVWRLMDMGITAEAGAPLVLLRGYDINEFETSQEVARASWRTGTQTCLALGTCIMLDRIHQSQALGGHGGLLSCKIAASLQVQTDRLAHSNIDSCQTSRAAWAPVLHADVP